MGLYDRDYMQPERARRQFGGMPLLSVNTWLIVICCAIYLIDRFATRTVGEYLVKTPDGLVMQMSVIEFWGHFSAGMALHEHQLWRFVTFQFLHANFTHLLFNMIALFMFGQLIEGYLGRKRYLVFYLLCGASGALFYMILWAMHLLVTTPYMPLVGASAGIFGVLIAAARVAPNVVVLIFGIIPMPLRTLAWWLIAIAIFTVFTAGHNAGGEAAHLGGAALGYLLIRYPQFLNLFDSRFRSRRPATY
jgi:membrane associated rhomboid family serine protease